MYLNLKKDDITIMESHEEIRESDHNVNNQHLPNPFYKYGLS